MKKRLLGLSLGVAIAFSAFMANTRSSKEAMSDLMMENVEALAWDENNMSGGCDGLGSVVCPWTGQEVEYVYIYNSLK